MARPKQQPTEVISFRIPREIAQKVDKQARKEKKKRSKFVEALFIPAFNEHLQEKTV